MRYQGDKAFGIKGTPSGICDAPRHGLMEVPWLATLIVQLCRKICDTNNTQQQQHATVTIRNSLSVTVADLITLHRK